MFSMTIRVDREKLDVFRHECDFQYDPDLDDIRSVLAHVGNLLQDSDSVSCEMSACNKAWPVDAVVDLPILIEQLPEAIRAIDSEAVQGFELEFFEQQPPMVLVFEKRADKLLLRCEDMLSRGTPNSLSDESSEHLG